MINVAINGFGRIGRAVLKIMIDRTLPVKIVAINDLTDAGTLAQLLKFDSAYGRYDKEVKADSKNLYVGGIKIPVLAEKDPTLLPWKALNVDIVIECTGRFTNKVDLTKHLKAGARKVVLSAPVKSKEDKVKTIVIGVNDKSVKASDNILSCASCTTNCLAPVVDVIEKNFGIKQALMTTIHSYTADQNLVDGPHKDLRRARAAAVNIVPTTTGAALAVTETIPKLKDKFDGLAVRVPTIVGSLCDTVFVTKKKVTVEKVNSALIKASKGDKKGILDVSTAPLVSSDIIGNAFSSIVDLPLTKVVGDDLLKVVSWYDNEFGYSNRLVDLALIMAKK